MQSSATTVSEYLAGLAEDRRGAIKAVRDVIDDIAAAVPIAKYVEVAKRAHAGRK